jgi:hypothetical protein
MPVIGPKEGSQYEEAYTYIMDYLKTKWHIQDSDWYGMMGKVKGPKERELRNAEFKEALRRLFELDAWEGW